MTESEEIAEASADLEERELKKENKEPRTFFDYLSLAVTTCGVGYMPVAPGTFGSLVGVIIYLWIVIIEASSIGFFLEKGLATASINAWIWVFNLVLFLLFCLLGIRASGRATKLFKDKDPQKVVVDEVMGQLLVFLFVPFLASWWMIIAGFLFFRLFDIWKPYPIDYLQNLPAGLGVCADDLLAGVYGGICLSIVYAISLSF
jgi:phosphatidylglycerophosphatase A